MSTPFDVRDVRPAPASPERQGLPAWLRFGLIGGLVLVTSLLLAHEIVSPDVRTVQILFAGVLLVAALRVSSFTSLLFIAIAIPTYKPTTYGGTTLAFVLVLFILWMVRVSLKLERGAQRTPIDPAVAALFFAYLLSLGQLESMANVRSSIFNIFNLMTHIMVCYMVIQLTRTEKQLRTLFGALIVMAALIDLTAVWELMFPGRALIPGWLNLGAEWAGAYARKGFEIKGLRVAGVFFDYELLAEFCAMAMLMMWFLFQRTQVAWKRVGMGALLVLNTFVLFSTVTRGAIVSLGIGSAYLIWHMRRRIRFRTFVIGLFIVIGGGWFVLDFVSHHTHSGNILERFEKTEFKGLVPETRVGVWKQSWERILQKPIFGHGPYYGEKTKGVEQILFPHNNYLFYWHMLGIIGLAAFIWLLTKLWRATRNHADSLTDPTFSRALLFMLRAMLILFFVDQIKIEFLRNPVYPYWVWMFFGLIVATSRVAAEQSPVYATAPSPRTAKARLRPIPVAPVSPLASS